MAVRLPGIARRMMVENDLNRVHIDEVEHLIDEIGSGHITVVDEPAAPDASAWAAYIEPYLGLGWLDAPWFFVETYFYRRLLAAVGYSRRGPRRLLDPFRRQKEASLGRSMGLATALADLNHDQERLMHSSLWANQVDLSLWPAGGSDRAAETRTDAVTGSDRSHKLLADDTEATLAALNVPDPSVHIVLDNAGAELVADLALVAALVQSRARVVIHAKSHPTFVSDATPSDVTATLQQIEVLQGKAAAMARTVANAIDSGAVRLTASPFWVSPLAMWEMPPRLAAGFRDAALIVVKGDANYRRLLGDRHWPFDSPFGDVVRPPGPLAALRTLKAEVAAGIPATTIERVAAQDEDWMVNGEWGLIQLAPPVPTTGADG